MECLVLKSLREEARLSEIGAQVQRERILTGLVNRLRMIDHIRRYPEILDEEVDVVSKLVFASAHCCSCQGIEHGLL